MFDTDVNKFKRYFYNCLSLIVMRTKIKVLKNSPVLVEGRGGEWNNFGTFAGLLSMSE